MPIRKPFLLLFALLLLPIAAAAQDSRKDPKQELNDQFWEAVRKGDLPAVTALLDKGADVNAKFRYGSTALFKAAERGHTDVVKLLLARGADATVKDTYYSANAMSWALQNKHFDAALAILEKDPDSVEDVLQTGVREGNVALVNAAISKGGLKAEALTAALVQATEEQKNDEIAALLKKAGAVPPPQIDAATLQSYVGRFKGDPGPELAVTLKDGKLFAAPTGQQPLLLIALDKTSFKPAAFDGLTLTFNVEAGKATSIALKQGPNTTQLKRIADQ
jgi:ankyrin repeat protein